MCSKFEPARDVPDLSGKIVLVTGANSGIGYETVKVLLLKNARVYLAARSAEKAKEAIKQLETKTGKQAQFLELDLADLRSVRRAANDFLARESRLDILFNNGGVMIPPSDELTVQGYDLQFGTNTIGHFMLTELLLPALTVAHTHSGTPARIIHTSSSGHSGAAPRADFFDSLKGGPKRDALVKKWGSLTAPWTLYGSSKLGNIILANHYAATHTPDVLVSCSLHPGLIRSGIQRHGPGVFKFVTGLAFSPTPVGAYTQLWAGTTATPEQINAKYFMPVGVDTRPGGRTGDGELAKEVIQYLKAAIAEF
ncbi:NAD(P)-binding protein [Mycena belliarum]|uniref:NAD(P)-binding protein n=1 Tax=Mycena belliarum TaxID=1033014 RepID=A0AAD6U370_9AGAR|nr:NAD(P)-binding protein [Mycena belliae]